MNKKFSSMKISLGFFLVLLSSATSIRYSICHINDQQCQIEGLLLTDNDFLFTPIANNMETSPISSIIFDTACQIPVLYNNVCDMFPNLQIFHASAIGIKLIDPLTFSQCPHLIEIRLHDNQIRHLDASTFHHNGNLRILDLGNNCLTSFNPRMLFSLVNLTFLSFSNNFLQNFPVDALWNMTKLQELHLHGNDLLEVDVEKLVSFSSDLKVLLLTGNLLRCDKVEQIVKVLNSNEIPLFDVPILRNHERVKNQYKSISCIREVDWNNVKLVRNFPLLEKEIAECKDSVEGLRIELEDMKENFKYIVKSLMEKNKHEEQQLLSDHPETKKQKSPKLMKCETFCVDPDLDK